VAGAARAFALLDEAPDVLERPGAQTLARGQGAIRFDHVDFRYAGGRDVLRDVTVDVPAGTSVGIQGRTGVGKTTLINLLFRMHDPTRGAVTLDGVDLRDYKLDDLRRQFSLVLQDPVLFATTIAENIAYARPTASHDEIVAAAKAANAHDFIVGLPDGYDTLVGERGMRLSGGERQRVSLARAFLKDAPILVLDEPTSAVDGATEGLIVDALRRLMCGRTTFMIAHRPAALDLCDVRFELESGRVRAPASATPTTLHRLSRPHPSMVGQTHTHQEQTPYEPS
jgi:ATP-binding cassette subfamily B protein